MTNSPLPTKNEKAPAFAPGDFVVYPAHGVGKVLTIETREISDQKIKLLVIEFDRERMTLRVPLPKVKASGLRSISTKRVMAKALTALKGRAAVKRSMWRHRALEYTAKISSGDPVAIAEVVRDLHRDATSPERSHSARLLYEQARDRLTHEVAAIEKIEFEAATTKLERLLDAA